MIYNRLGSFARGDYFFCENANNYFHFGQNIVAFNIFCERNYFMFTRKRSCMNPYLAIMLMTLAAVGVVSMADKGRCLCASAMEAIKDKMPLSIMHPKSDAE